MLAPWGKAREVLGRSFPIRGSSNEPEAFVVAVAVDSGVVDVECRSITTQGQAWIAMMVELAPANQARLSTAMYVNMELALGTLCMHRGVVFMRHALPLDMDEPMLVRCVRRLADAAVFVRERVITHEHDQHVAERD